MPKAVVSWDIRNTTGDLDLRVLTDLSTRAFRKRYSSPFPLTGTFRKAMSCFTKDSKQMVNKAPQRTANRRG